MAQDDGPNWGRFVGLGLQVAIGVTVGLLIGRWLDQRYGWRNDRGAIIGAMIGLAGGLYLLIKEAIALNRDK